jgi:peptidoglycan/xylan/chitin deacetylase (PgdA/CDA1 family)
MTSAGPRARIRAASRDPLSTIVTWQARRNSLLLAERQARLARRSGIDQVFLVLSFDCDTNEDAAVAPHVHGLLGELGVVPTYAVPGELLRRGVDTYKPLAKAGAEFINHGGVGHTYYDDALGRHVSCFFYDELDPERVRRDIEEGDSIVEDVLGRRAVGFRTPHFGTYQSSRQLRYLHDVLIGLEYRFSSSTTPRFGFRHGPVARHLGLPEFPVTGTPLAPFEILDTWAFFAAPDRTRNAADFLAQAEVLARTAETVGAGVINVYGDPIHIHDRPEFFAAVAAWTQVAEPISYTGLLDRIGI